MRCRYHALLQLAAFVTVVAFHSELPGFTGGWIAVELFFALAGYNMASVLQTSTPLRHYLLTRYRRLALPLLVLAPAVLVLVLLGSRPALVYALSAPLQVHNLLRVAMDEAKPTDMVWLPTWFIGALFQLQVLALLLKPVLLQARVMLVMLGVTGVGVAFRSFGGLLLDGEGALSFASADALYWAPLTHVEALVGGLQLGLGRFQRLRRFLPAIAVLVVLSVLALAASSTAFPTIAFPLGTGAGHEHIWGYAALATGAVLLIDKRQAIARFVLGLAFGARLDRAIESLSRLTFMGYLLHGAILALLTRLLASSASGLAFSTSLLGQCSIATAVVGFALLGAAVLHRISTFVARRGATESP
jgi:peptidoglycan/LPS O-acetylase OafA/YrhL